MVLTVAGLSGAAGAAPARCDLTLTASPSTLPAGLHPSRVRIPASSPDIQLRASSGTVGPPVSAGTGAMVAEFTADARSPPLVIIAAVGESFCGFSIVRIRSAPEAAIVPRPVTLVVIEPPTAPGDADTEVEVYVFAVDEKGVPRRGTAPTFKPGAGSIRGVKPLGPGVWQGRWRIRAGKAAETQIEVAFGSGALARGSLGWIGLPAALEIEEDPASNANGIPGAVIVRIRDSAGHLTDGTVEVEADLATVGVPVRLERGVYRAPLLVTTETQGKSLFVIATANRIHATVTLLIPSPPPAMITVGPHGPIHADGSAPGRPAVLLPITVTDASGRAVNDVPVGSAQLGEIFDARVVGPGSWTLPYRPPRVLEDSVDHITVRAGTVSTHADLHLSAARFSGSIGLKAGIVVASSVGPSIGVEGSAWASVGGSRLGMTLDLGWWTLSQTSAATVGGSTSTYHARQNYLPVLLSFSWRKLFARQWLFWVGAGGGVDMVWSSSQVSGQASVSESGLAPAASASVSAGPRLGPGAPFLELRVTWLGDAKLSTLSGSTVNFLALLGYRFDVI